MPEMLLNADMGESFGPWVMGCDEQLMPHVDLANVACGFHASDPQVMRHTVKLAMQHGVRVGAHPAYPDLQGFGRRSMNCSPEEVEAMVLYQVGALAGVCRAEGTQLHYVKPHGALYNDMARDPALFAAVARAVYGFDPALPLVTLARRDTSEVREVAASVGVTLWFEAFADRAYTDEGFLAPRREPGSVHHDTSVIVDQAVRIAGGRALTSVGGESLTLAADTLCVHGDNPESIAAVKAIREALTGPVERS